MNTYHKIQTTFKRDPENNYKTLLIGEYSSPEFEYLANNEWVFTEKVDGTNIRVMFDGEQITFAGKTDKAQIPPFLLEELNNIFIPQLDNFKSIFDDAVCLYGEGYGARIQKGGGNYISGGVSFVLFDILINDWWLKREDVEDVGNKLDIDIVPTIFTGTLPDMVKLAQDGFTSRWGDFQAEGIVARPQVELKSRSGARIITKIKCKDFHG